MAEPSATPGRKATAAKGGVAQLAALLDQGGLGGRGRRSSLSRWLRAHHDAFAAMLADKEPSWDEVAAALAAMGLRDGQDKPPTGERARKAWWTARRTKAGARARRQAAPSPPLEPGEVAPGVRAAAPPKAPLSQDLPPFPPTAGTGASPAPATAPNRDGGRPAALSDAEVQRVLDDLAQKQGGPKLPLPRIM